MEKKKQNSVTVGSLPTERSTPAEAAAGAANLAAYLESSADPPALKHGIRALMTTGKLPAVPGATEVAKDVDALISQMVVDMGYSSHAELPAQRRAVLASQRLALLILGLAGEFLAREGIVNAKGRPHPLLAVLGTFGNSVRLNAVALGLDRKARSVVTLEEYLEARTAVGEKGRLMILTMRQGGREAGNYNLAGDGRPAVVRAVVQGRFVGRLACVPGGALWPADVGWAARSLPRPHGQNDSTLRSIPRSAFVVRTQGWEKFDCRVYRHFPCLLPRLPTFPGSR